MNFGSVCHLARVSISNADMEWEHSLIPSNPKSLPPLFVCVDLTDDDDDVCEMWTCDAKLQPAAMSKPDRERRSLPPS